MAPYPRYALSLFTGIGGGELATQHLLGWRTVGYVEKDSYCVEVLKTRIQEGYLHDAPIWSDVRSFTKRNNATRRYIRTLRQMAHELVITGGFPCQPFSAAGLQKAGSDERNGWTDTIRIIREIRPRWCFLENVAGLLTGSHGYFGTVLSDLVSSGYSVNWRCLSAAEVGAAHKRDRLWIVAHANEYRLPGERDEKRSLSNAGRQPSPNQPQWSDGNPSPQPDSQITTDSDGIRLQESIHVSRRDEAAIAISHRSDSPSVQSGYNGITYWQTEPRLGRLADGVPHWMERVRANGNGQVPQVAATAWRLLSQEF